MLEDRYYHRKGEWSDLVLARFYHPYDTNRPPYCCDLLKRFPNKIEFENLIVRLESDNEEALEEMFTEQLGKLGEYIDNFSRA